VTAHKKKGQIAINIRVEKKNLAVDMGKKKSIEAEGNQEENGQGRPMVLKRSWVEDGKKNLPERTQACKDLRSVLLFSSSSVKGTETTPG